MDLITLKISFVIKMVFIVKSNHLGAFTKSVYKLFTWIISFNPPTSP